MVFTASLLGAQHCRDGVENKRASLLVVTLGKALKRDASIVMWQTGGGAEPVAQSDEKHAKRA